MQLVSGGWVNKHTPHTRTHTHTKHTHTYTQTLTDSPAVCLQGHAAVFLLQVLVTQQYPGQVVSWLQPDGSTEVSYRLIMVPTKTVEVAYIRERESSEVCVCVCVFVCVCVLRVCADL